MFKNIRFAQTAFETALRLGALEPQSWGRLGLIYKLRGFSQKAQECLLRAGVRNL
jgi:Flp pilus assembly protein TadD